MLILATVILGGSAGAAPVRPVVVIPGILGSVLAKDGGTVWGDRLSLLRFERLEILDGPRNPEPNEVFEVVGLIHTIQILGPWKVKQYDGLREAFSRLGYAAGIDYFEFAYDWRQSNLKTAEVFRRWVESNERLREREFDIVAHSMGGLVAEVFVKRYDAARQVRVLVTLGTPFLDSANAVATPFYGWGRLANLLAGGIEDIRRIVLSFPSIYELMPTYPDCCILGRPEETNRTPFNSLAPEGFAYVDWGLPAAIDTPERAARVQTVLEDAATLSRIISEPMPEHLRGRVYRIAGDHIETRGQYYVDAGTGDIVHWNNFLGDGTVLVRSASKDEIGSAYLSFAEHSVIFEDEVASNHLMRVFCDNCYGPVEYGASDVLMASTAEGDLVRVRGMDVDLDPPVLLPGDEIKVEVCVTSESGQPVDQLPVFVALYLGDAVEERGGCARRCRGWI